MHPEDAGRLGVREGETVRLTSRYGSASLPVHLNARIAPGQLFATFHSPAVFLNAVTSPHLDPASGTPEYKLTAVRLDRIS
jgi:formate dehydrogenase major subunit